MIPPLAVAVEWKMDIVIIVTSVLGIVPICMMLLLVAFVEAIVDSPQSDTVTDVVTDWVAL